MRWKPLAAGAAALVTGAVAGGGPAAAGLAAGRGVAFAVVTFDAGVAERAALTLRLASAESSTTTVTPASASVRSSFLAWLGVTSASSTARATAAEVSWPPEPAAWAMSASVRVRTSVPVWRASVTNDLPEARNASTAGPANVARFSCLRRPARRHCPAGGGAKILG